VTVPGGRADLYGEVDTGVYSSNGGVGLLASR
jgi:hypothetical protein